jgi:hypothetical protein
MKKIGLTIVTKKLKSTFWLINHLTLKQP